MTPESNPPLFQDHFSAAASQYAAHRPSYPAPLIEHICSVAPSHQLAWDCGCGSGQFSKLLARYFRLVIATDASPEQIAHAEAHPSVEYRCAPSEDCGLPNDIVDLVVAAQAAHWFDLPRYYAEVRRVSRPNAVIVLVAYGIPSIDEEADRIIACFYRDVLGPFWPPERRHVESGYRSLPFPFEEWTAPHFEMRERWNLTQWIGYMDTWSAVRELEKTIGRAPFDAICQELGRVWASPDEVRVVRWPVTLRMGRIE